MQHKSRVRLKSAIIVPSVPSLSLTLGDFKSGSNLVGLRSLSPVQEECTKNNIFRSFFTRERRHAGWTEGKISFFNGTLCLRSTCEISMMVVRSGKRRGKRCFGINLNLPDRICYKERIFERKKNNVAGVVDPVQRIGNTNTPLWMGSPSDWRCVRWITIDRRGTSVFVSIGCITASCRIWGGTFGEGLKS